MDEFRITFSDGTRKVLTDISQALGTSIGDVIRDALSLYWWFARERSSGSRLLVQRGSQITELVVPSLERLTRKAGCGQRSGSGLILPLGKE